MANPEHIQILKQSVATWNPWRTNIETLGQTLARPASVDSTFAAPPPIVKILVEGFALPADHP
jgi:hypothetical protein